MNETKMKPSKALEDMYNAVRKMPMSAEMHEHFRECASVLVSVVNLFETGTEPEPKPKQK